MDRRLLQTFLEAYPFQPATAVWRAVEIAELARVAFPGGVGLDLGCGDGRLTRILGEAIGGLRLVGLDLDRLETELARNAGIYERVHTAGAASIPEPDATFEFVVSVSVMEHIPDLQMALASVARVLKPGGQLIATCPSVGFHACLRGPLLPGWSRKRYLDALDARLAHRRYWSADEWRGALGAVGLRLVHVRSFLTQRDVRRWETISRFTAGLLHTLTRHKPPIEIQRSLGFRRTGQRLAPALARILALVLAAGLDGPAPVTERESGCVLLVARKDSGSGVVA